MSKNKIRQHQTHTRKELGERKKTKKSFLTKILDRIVTYLFGAEFLENKKNYPILKYLVFLCLLFMIYIAYGYRTEKLVRKVNALQHEVSDLRAEYIFTTGELMFVKKQSHLSDRTKKLGLVSSTTPPHIIITSAENLEKDE